MSPSEQRLSAMGKTQKPRALSVRPSVNVRFREVYVIEVCVRSWAELSHSVLTTRSDPNRSNGSPVTCR